MAIQLEDVSSRMFLGVLKVRDVLGSCKIAKLRDRTRNEACLQTSLLNKQLWAQEPLHCRASSCISLLARREMATTRVAN